MTARASPDVHKKAATGTKRRTKKAQPKVTPYPVIELTEDMRQRFAELAHRGVVDDICAACQSAVGLPKMLRDGKTQWICPPCHITLYYHRYTFDLTQWRLLRLPYYRYYLNEPDKASELLMLLARQENYSK